MLLMRGTPSLREIGTPVGTLPYLVPDDSNLGGYQMRRIRAPHGSKLAIFLDAAKELSIATGWQLIAAVHHLFTGRLMSSPVRAVARGRWGSQRFGGPMITIEVVDPFGVDDQEIVRAYRNARASLDRSAATRGEPETARQRSRSSTRADLILAFMSMHSTEKWEDVRRAWNESYPDMRYANSEALRSAHRRALRRR